MQNDAVGKSLVGVRSALRLSLGVTPLLHFCLWMNVLLLVPYWRTRPLQVLASIGILPWLIFLCVVGLPSEVYSQSFQREITPVLTKAGCNRGSCHGAAAGRGGFRLSLYGSDPAADYREIVQQLGGRRIHRVYPEQSLLLRKATESIEHGGGQRLLIGGEGVKRIETWISNGAYWVDSGSSADSQVKQSPEKLDAVVSDIAEPVIGVRHLRVTPTKVVLAQVGDSIPLQAEATFADGTSEDVTNWTVFEAEDDSSLEIDRFHPRVTARRHGRHLIIARYLTQVVPIEILVPYPFGFVSSTLTHAENHDLEMTDEVAGSGAAKIHERSVIHERSGIHVGAERLGGDGSHDVAGEFIDRWVNHRLSVLRLPASPQCDDATFFRRACLDLTGRLPTSWQYMEYFDHPEQERRGWWIETLIASDAFNHYWTFKLAELFRLRRLPNSQEAMERYHTWIGSQLRESVGYDQIVKSLLTARGDASEIGPANFLRTVAGPRERAELVSEVFMASRLRCANCHDHPLDRWTQDDYHGLSAVFATIRVGDRVVDQPNGKVTHPKTGKDARPKLPGGSWLEGSSQNDGLPSLGHVYADWLLEESNPYFAKAIVNRLWKSMMGRGLVEPVDDFRETNPASHPELLARLAEHFVESGCDLRSTLKVIARSAAYQRSSMTVPGNASDTVFYSHYYDRSLRAEVLADAISDVLEMPAIYGNEPVGTRAIDLVDPQIESRSLDVLGRCSRETTCDAADSGSGSGLSAKLFLLNGSLINGRLESDENRLANLMKAESNSVEIIKTFYQVALQRSPKESELDYWMVELENCDPEDRSFLLRDFVWSLLACREFTTNH